MSINKVSPFETASIRIYFAFFGALFNISVYFLKPSSIKLSIFLEEAAPFIGFLSLSKYLTATADKPLNFLTPAKNSILYFLPLSAAKTLEAFDATEFSPVIFK